MEKAWLKSYPEGVPSEISLNDKSSGDLKPLLVAGRL